MSEEKSDVPQVETQPAPEAKVDKPQVKPQEQPAVKVEEKTEDESKHDKKQLSYTYWVDSNNKSRELP